MGISVEAWRQAIGGLQPGRSYKRRRREKLEHPFFEIISYLMYWDDSGLRDFTILEIMQEIGSSVKKVLTPSNLKSFILTIAVMLSLCE